MIKKLLLGGFTMAMDIRKSQAALVASMGLHIAPRHLRGENLSEQRAQLQKIVLHPSVERTAWSAPEECVQHWTEANDDSLPEEPTIQ